MSKTNTSVTSKLHIDVYDPSKGQTINSPRSLEAMRFHGIAQDDLKLATKDDLKLLFNLTDPEEQKAFEKCVEKNKRTYDSLKNKVSTKRKELIKIEEEELKKKKEADAIRQKQLKALEEEKKRVVVQLEEERKKREADIKEWKEKRDKAELARLKKYDITSTKDEKKTGKKDKDKSPSKKEIDKSPSKKELDKSPSKKEIDKSPSKKELDKPILPEKKDQPLSAQANSRLLDSSLGLSKKGTRPESVKKPILLDEELKNSTFAQYLDKSIHHKDLLDMGLRERTKKDLQNDKTRISELMYKQQRGILEMSQKRNQSAYKSQTDIGNAKTRKIEYMFELRKDPVELLKEKQQKEMEDMMDYEIGLQLMRKQREEFLQNKQNYFKGEQQYKEVVFEYNKKIIEREKRLKEMQKKMDHDTKMYHVSRTKKANEFKRAKMLGKLKEIDMKATNMKEDRKDFQISRQLMMQKLRKDLDMMRAGMIDMHTIEHEYHFLRNDQEFRNLMVEIKKELHPDEKDKKARSVKINLKALRPITTHHQASGGLSPKKEEIGKSRSRSPSPDKSLNEGKEDDRKKKAEVDDIEKKKKIAETQFKQNKEVTSILDEEQKREKERKKELEKIQDALQKEKLELKFDQERIKVKEKMKNMVRRHAEELARLQNS